MSDQAAHALPRVAASEAAVVVPGDLITAHIDGLPSLTITVTSPET